MSNWRDISQRVIADVHGRLDQKVSFADRRAAIDAAYPFGPRRYHPYKMWLAERKAYLARWSDKPSGPLFAEPHGDVPRDGRG